MLIQSLFALSLLVSPSRAANPVPQSAATQVFSAPQAPWKGFFGRSVALDGNRAAIGSPQLLDYPANSASGEAFIYTRSGASWVHEATLTAPTPSSTDRFGESVALEGDWLAVGEPGREWVSPGAVHFFQRTGTSWVLRQSELGSFSNSNLGDSLAIEGDLIVVGASGDNHISTYRLAGGSWALEQRFPLQATGFSTGFSLIGEVDVAISGDRIVAGLPRFYIQGVVGVFDRGAGGWNQTALLTGSQWTGAGDLFGAEVAFSGDRILVGASGTDQGEGVVYAFEPASGGTWNEAEIIRSTAPVQGEHFGASFTTQGEVLVAGAIGSSAVNVFVDRSGAFELQDVLMADAGLAWSDSLALDGAQILAGSPGVSLGIANSGVEGAAYDPATNTHYGISQSRLSVLLPDFDSYELAHFFSVSLESLAWDPASSALLSVDTAADELVSIDPAGGTLAVIGAVGFDDVRSLALNTNTGALFGFDYASKNLISISPATGVGSIVGPSANGIQGLAYDAVSDTLYGVGVNTKLYTLNQLAGNATVIANTHPGAGESLAFDSSQQRLLSNGDYNGSPIHVVDPADASWLTPIPIYSKGAGVVSAFTLNLTSNYCTAGVSAYGCAAAIASSGDASASAASGFQLLATDVEGGRKGLFFYGSNGRQANPWGTSSSLQCVAPPVARAGILPAVGTTGSCDGSFAQDLNALWCPSCPKAGSNPGPGALVQAQLWYRDPLSTSNQSTGFSDAIEFLVGL